MQVKLSDGHIATAHNEYAGKSRRVTVDGETRYWPRDQMTEEVEEELTVAKVPAIDRLEELLRYEKVFMGEDNVDYHLLVHALRTEAREELRREYGV